VFEDGANALEAYERSNSLGWNCYLWGICAEKTNHPEDLPESAVFIALQRLADTADNVCARHFDDDDLTPSASDLLDATEHARAVLRAARKA
jgi:hypothetical protein